MVIPDDSIHGCVLRQVLDNTNLKLWCEAKLAVVHNSFMWLTAVLPYLVVAHRYFAGEIEFGVISQVFDVACVFWGGVGVASS